MNMQAAPAHMIVYIAIYAPATARARRARGVVDMHDDRRSTCSPTHFNFALARPRFIYSFYIIYIHCSSINAGIGG